MPGPDRSYGVVATSMTDPDPGRPLPSVTLVVAMRNEAANIGACLESILGQSYPEDRLEILVYDGDSDDGSRSIAERLLAGRPRAAVLGNPLRTQATSWNLGIDAAWGEAIGIVSGHVVLDPGYVAAAVECLYRTGADMVGGPVRAVGQGIRGAAIALAMTTPFGVGGATFRYLDREQEVDTVFMGVCRAETYRRFRFDPTMVRDQDDELSYRLLDAGGRIVCSPSIGSSYVARGSLSALWSQYHAYGFWKVLVASKHPDQVRPRHLAPTALVTAVAVPSVAALWSPLARVALAAVLGSYGMVMTAQVLAVRDRARAQVLAMLPVVYPVLHLAYGVGFLRGLLSRRDGMSVLAAALGTVLRRASS